MPFRDDRDALRARSEALETDLDDAREQLEKAERALADHEQKDTRDARQVKDLNREVDKLRKRVGMTPRQPPSRAPLIGAVVGLAVVGVVAGLWLFASSSEPEPMGVSQTQATVPIPSPPMVPHRAPDLVTTPLDVARFGAEVLSAEGLPLAPGSACVLAAQLEVGPAVSSVRVSCGDLLVYESKMDGGTEMTIHETDAREVARGEEFAYKLGYGDTGQRTGPRPQLRVRGDQGQVTLWRDNDDPFRLTLRIDDHSALRVGVALGRHDTAPTGSGFRHRAIATRSTGPAPNVPDDGCEVLAHPDSASGQLNCRVFVRCGSNLVYGADGSGYNICTMEDGVVDAANDTGPTSENADPILRMSRSEGTMTLADDIPADWEIQFRLEEDPRCNLEGMWTGTMTEEDGASERITLTGGEQVVLTRVMARSTALASDASVELNCRSGSARLTDDAGNIWEGSFGPGYQTLIGRVRGGTPTLFELHRAAPDELPGPL